MIFVSKEGKFYEIPKERYAEFEVNSQRAAEILSKIKNKSSNNNNNNEVAGYWYPTVHYQTDSGKIVPCEYNRERNAWYCDI